MLSKSIALVLALALASCGGCSTNPGPGDPTPSPTPATGYDCGFPPSLSGVVPVANAIAGRYIVVLKQKPPLGVQNLMTAEGVSEAKTMRQGYAARLAATAISRILADPNTAYIQQDGVKSVSPRPAEAAAVWGIDRIDQRALPLDGDYSPGADGSGVNIAIIDTGITSHPDFADRLQTPCFSAHGACTDGHGHGTHVAGTSAGKTWGVAKKASLYAVRVLDSNGSGSDSDVIRGIEWVIGRKQSAPAEQWVINMSLGGSPAPALDRAVCDALSTGVVVAVAAGNESANADTSSPARVLQAITVGASDRGDRQASFSNFGSLLDLYAPGVDITSSTPTGSTATWSGTSMATPHVAGAAALFLQRHTGSSPQAVRDGLVAAASAMSWVSETSPPLLLYVKED